MSYIAVGLGAATLIAGIWQGQQKRKDDKKAQKKAGQNLDQAHFATVQKANIKQLRQQNAQLAQVANAAIAEAQRGALSEDSSKDKMILYAALGVGAIVLLKGK
jgi:hypothetical protein